MALRDRYFLVLYEGKSVLLKRVTKTFRLTGYKGAYTNLYYVFKPDQALTKGLNWRKIAARHLSHKGDALKAFLADKLNLKTETDAATLVQHYDGL